MPDLLTAHAAAQPDKPAVIDDRGAGRIHRRTYAQLEARANQLAHVLLDQGARRGSKVVWCGQNSVGVVEAVHAVRKIGAVGVPLNYRLSDDEAAYVVDHSDATLVFVDAEFAPLFDRISAHIPQVRSIVVFDGTALTGMIDGDIAIDRAPTSPPDVADDGEGVASAMIYTSGTTGKPKGALRRSVGDPGQTAAMLDVIGCRPDDVYLTTGPLYHSGPGGFMSLAALLGQTIVVQRKFDPIGWLTLLQTYRCTSTFAAPTPIRTICNLPDATIADFDRSSMRIMIANAAPWSFALKQQYVARFPPTSLFEVYGSTELGVNTILRPEDQMRKPGSCGREAPMVEIRLYDADENIVTATGPKATGEVYVRSASVFADYYKQHEQFEVDHRDGFQTVGDIAFRDDEGFLYICDRKKDMIISGGMNIYPAEIEAALESHPGVYEAAVIGIPSDEWGEAVHAVVVRQPGSELDDVTLVAHARSLLAGYKLPRSIVWVGQIPKTGSGKVLKRALRRPYWEDRASHV